MAAFPFSTLTVDHAAYDSAKRIVGWSSSPAAVCVGSVAGMSLLDRTFPAIRSIGAVAVGPTQTISMIGIPASAPAAETCMSVFFVAAGIIVHTSPKPLPLWCVHDTTAVQTPPLLKCLRLGGLDMCLVSAVGMKNVTLYQRQDPDAIEAVALDDDIILMEDGPFHGSVFCVLKNGKVVVVSVEERPTSKLYLAAVTEVDTGVQGIHAAKCAGRSLLWLLANDGRLFAYQAVGTSSSSSSVAPLTEDESAPVHSRSLSISRGEVFSLVRVSFGDAAGAVGHGERLSGFTVSVGAVLWADDTSLSACLAVLGVEDNEGSVELTKVTVDVSMSAFVTSVALELEAKALLSLSAQPHQWDILVVHPRKNIVERAVLDVGPAMAANAPMANLAIGGEVAIKTLCSNVAWAPHDQLGLLRNRCEVILDSLEKRSALTSSVSEAQDCTRTLISLQHTALAFLKREHQDTDAAINPENSVSHFLLRRLRQVYLRTVCNSLLLAADFLPANRSKSLEEVLGLAQARDHHASSRDIIRASFYESFQMTATQEHPRAAVERWGYPHQPPSLAIDVFARECGLDLRQTTVNDFILRFPQQSASESSTPLVVMLLYIVQSSSLQHVALTKHVAEFLRTLDAPYGMWAWATLMYAGDHPNGRDEDDSPGEVPECSCLESCMPFVPLLLPSLMDGLMYRGRFADALKLGRFGLSLYPPRAIPHALGSKLLLLAYRGGDAALITQIASHSRGATLSSLAVRAVALVSQHLESLCMADGLYEHDSDEFRLLEEALSEQAAKEGSGSFVSSALLCELRLGGAKRYEATDTAAAKIASKVPSNQAQQFYAFREHLRAHLTSAAAQQDQTSDLRPSTAPPARRTTTCLRELDESLDDAVRSTSSSSIALHRASTQQSRRTAPFASALRPNGSLGLFAPSSTTVEEDGAAYCDRMIGDLGKICKKLRPCPFHDANSR